MMAQTLLLLMADIHAGAARCDACVGHDRTDALSHHHCHLGRSLSIVRRTLPGVYGCRCCDGCNAHSPIGIFDSLVGFCKVFVQ